MGPGFGGFAAESGIAQGLGKSPHLLQARPMIGVATCFMQDLGCMVIEVAG